MNFESFKTRSRRLGAIYFFAFFAVSIPLLLLVLYGAHRVSVRFGFDHAVVYVLAIPLACVAFVAGGFVMQGLDRRFGLRCPHCGCSLTFGHDPRKILAAGICPECGVSLFR